MQHNGGAIAASAIRDEVMEIALERPHEALVARQHLGGQATVAAALHLLQVGGLEAGLRVPQIDVVLALVAEEERGAAIGAQQHRLLAIGFRAHIDDGASALAHPQILALNRIEARRAQVAEEERRGAVGLGSQRYVEHIVGRCRGPGQHNAVRFVARDIIDQNATSSSISHIAARERGRERAKLVISYQFITNLFRARHNLIRFHLGNIRLAPLSLGHSHKGLVILGVVDDYELQTALGGHEIAEVNAFHHLVVGRVYGHDFGAAAAYGLLQCVHNAHVQGPEQTLSKCIYILFDAI